MNIKFTDGRGGGDDSSTGKKVLLGGLALVVGLSLIFVGSRFIGGGGGDDDSALAAIADDVDKNVDGEDVEMAGEDVVEGTDGEVSQDDQESVNDSEEGTAEGSAEDGDVAEGFTPFKIGDPLELGAFVVTATSAKRVDDTVVISYDCTNNSGEVVNWSDAILSHVAQGESELGLASDDSEPIEIGSGQTVKGIKEVYTINSGEDIFLEVTELVSGDYARALVVFETPTK